MNTTIDGARVAAAGLPVTELKKLIAERQAAEIPGLEAELLARMQPVGETLAKLRELGVHVSLASLFATISDDETQAMIVVLQRARINHTTYNLSTLANAVGYPDSSSPKFQSTIREMKGNGVIALIPSKGKQLVALID